MRAKALFFTSVLLGVGCVQALPDSADSAADQDGQCDAESAAPDPDRFAARSGGTALTLLRVDEQYITGPEVSLGRYREEGHRVLRGRASDTVVELVIDEDHVSGVIGNDRVDVAVERDGTTVAVHGLLPGALSRLAIDASGMRGRLGRCMYDLDRTPDGFTGRRTCGGALENYTLDLPVAFASWTDAEIVAMFALFLGRR